MEDRFAALSQQELLALALEAARRGDSGHSLAYLKEACLRGDATAHAHFLLGSEYAQISLIDEAFLHFQRAVALAPDFAIARFQLGLLHLTHAQPDEAVAAWAPLAQLEAEHPLVAFSQGLRHLIRDEFPDCIASLEKGIALNNQNPALNTDMQRIIDKVRELPPAPDPGDKPEGPTEEEPQSHLFINAYTGGKVH